MDRKSPGPAFADVLLVPESSDQTARVSAGQSRSWAFAGALGIAIAALAVIVVFSGGDTVRTPGDFEAALTSAIEVTASTAGVEGLEVGYVDGRVASAVWFDSRRNGDVVVVQRTDHGVLGTGFSTPGSRARGSDVVTTLRVRVGGTLYEATIAHGESPEGWTVTEGGGGALAFGLALLDRSSDLGFTGGDGEVNVETGPGGGEVWTLTAPYADGMVAVTWERGPAGELGSHTFELVGVSAPNVPFPGFTSGRVDFTLIPDPDPILAPNPDERPDPSRFRVPDDLLLTFGSD